MTNKNKTDLLFHQLESADNLDLLSDSHEVGEYIQENLKDSLRPYQEKALRYFHYTQRKGGKKPPYKHLFFHMATGAGKTMVMASTILYLFKELGYQNFIFFVHTDAIIKKTKDNLLNQSSLKQLFNYPLKIDGQKIYIDEVETFPSIPRKDTISLKLTTIHKLHDDLSNYKENCITFEDFENVPVILLADEAHHYNASTKDTKNSQVRSWENTINKLLNSNPDNKLLEFSATIDLENNEILEKYKDKIVYQYDLKQFMIDGYSKKVMLLEADQSDDDKMLDAVLLSQYRKLIAIRNGIKDFKPIVLFKSNYILTSQSKHNDFIQLINDLTPKKVKEHLNKKALHLSSSTSVWQRIIQYYNSIDLISVIGGIQEDFSEMNLLNVNKNDVTEEYPELLNTLEDPNNPIRVVFAVAKLNEGWDVLNLYDIVRINEKSSKTKNSTDSEAQLIGRGARYYPFVYEGEKSFTRRFDMSSKDLSILEQLHYHTVNEPSYIKKLHDSLKQANVISNLDGLGKIKHARVKDSFKKTKVYEQGSLYYNLTKEVKDKERTWESYSLESEYTLTYNPVNETTLDKLHTNHAIVMKEQLLIVDKRYYYKAIHKSEFYTFQNLKRYFPELKSVAEFITSKSYLGGVKVVVRLPDKIDLDQVSAIEKLSLLEEVLTRIAKNISRNFHKSIGTYDFVSMPIREVVKDYSIQIDPSKIVNQRISDKPMIGQKWYVYDTAILNQLEHKLVDLIKRLMDKLKNKYDEIFIIRNDETSMRFKITEFNGVRGFMPDFIMIMVNNADNSYYQVFLEPKGDDRLKEDAWKESMLNDINDASKVSVEDESVRLVGVKFYALSRVDDFIKDLENKVYNGEALEESTSLLFE